MKQKIRRYLCSGGQGFTLVEAVVSIALFAILSLMIVTVLSVSLLTLRSTHNNTISANKAAGKVELDRANNISGTVTATPFVVHFGTSDYPQNGTYIKEPDGNITYYEFTPK